MIFTSTFMTKVTLFAPSLMNWVGICPWHISPAICSISYGVRCICGAFPHNYRQNNDGENWIIAWSSALILTRMDKSLHPGLPTSNLAQPSQIRSLWDICKEWISLAWSWSAFLHPCSGSSYGTQKLHKNGGKFSPRWYGDHLPPNFVVKIHVGVLVVGLKGIKSPVRPLCWVHLPGLAT